MPVKLGHIQSFVERLVATSHDIGLRVVTWTVDEPVVIRRLLDAGVDAIITDRPDVLREVLVSRDGWAPMGSGREAANGPLTWAVAFAIRAEDSRRPPSPGRPPHDIRHVPSSNCDAAGLRV